MRHTGGERGGREAEREGERKRESEGGRQRYTG